MKFTLSWLKRHLDTEADVVTLAERLTMIGHEVEEVRDRGAALKDFIVARVVEAQPHPNADKLRVCIVDTGVRHVQVVCGAPNARAGLRSVFAAPGMAIPGTNTILSVATVRGVESAGMLLSERELGLSDEHAGIVELPEDALIGAPAAPYLGVDDPLFDVAITPNRGDCLGVRGLARDLAAAGLGTLLPLDTAPVSGRFASPIGVVLNFPAAEADACPYFVGRLIRGVRNVASPKWLQDRLMAIGLRPISALVDVTNYMTVDVCRPLHVFDADRLQGGLTVRFARPGEALDALNGKTYTLDPAMTVIADDTGAQALGGVIGGANTGCGEQTVNVFVESALFDPLRTAATGRELSIPSDARYRFERGIDASFLEPGIELATRLILDLCGGEPSALVIAGAPPPPRPPIAFNPERVRTLAGVDVAEARCATILDALGFAVEKTGRPWQVTVPPWRNDVTGQACLVEEVVRIHGYDSIAPVSLPRPEPLPAPALTLVQRRRGTVRRLLAARGLTEAITFSFLSPAAARAFGQHAEAWQLVNPISIELSVMRPSLLPNLLGAVGRNSDRGIRDGALFEVGSQYPGDGEGEPASQRMAAAAIRYGASGPRHWATPPRPVDAYDAKADALAVLDILGMAVEKIQVVAANAPAWYHPGRSAALTLGPKQVLGYFGEIHPQILKDFAVRGSVVGCEIFVDDVPQPRAPGKGALVLSPLQSVERDFAFVVDEDVPAESIVRAARGAEKALISAVRVFDVFAGGSLGTGRKSIAISITLQPIERTLTDPEIEAVATRMVAAVSRATGATLRS